MNTLRRVYAVFAALFGAALLVWVAYDATLVMQALGLDGIVDEAAVAAATFALGIVFVAIGGLAWNRARQSVSAA